MPYVEIKLAGKVTVEQKQQIAAEIAKTLKTIAGKPEKSTYIVFQEIDRENWAVGPHLLSESS